jgi:hypothetical protein
MTKFPVADLVIRNWAFIWGLGFREFSSESSNAEIRIPKQFPKPESPNEWQMEKSELNPAAKLSIHPVNL